MDAQDIREHMPLIGSCGTRIGAGDRVEELDQAETQCEDAPVSAAAP